MSRFVTYLPRDRVQPPPTTRTRVARDGRRLHIAVARRTSQNVRKQYFQTKQTRKTQNVWRDVVRPSRCNAFAIACFLVLVIVVVVIIVVVVVVVVVGIVVVVVVVVV